ncbi:MAG: hypothetical protein JXR88_04870 [Clostridia bacterium]|nr:hypothetical protein [Clostridia bacterium]
MAPDTPEVRAILEKRAIEVAEAKGYTHGSEKWYDFIKGYVDPRGIPPMVVEDAIKNGTRIPGNTSDIIECFTDDVSVFINLSGDVVTVIPK